MPPRGKYKPRLATTSKQAFKTISEKSISSHCALRTITEWIDEELVSAKRNMDKPRQARLGELSHAVSKLALDLAEIEREANTGLAGRVEEPEETKEKPCTCKK